METRSTVQSSKQPVRNLDDPGFEDMEMWVKKIASTSKKVEVTLELEAEDLDDERMAQVKGLLSVQQNPVSVSIHPAE